MDLSEHEGYIFGLLANGWVATHTVDRVFRICGGPPEDMEIMNAGRRWVCDAIAQLLFAVGVAPFLFRSWDYLLLFRHHITVAAITTA